MILIKSYLLKLDEVSKDGYIITTKECKKFMDNLINKPVTIDYNNKKVVGFVEEVYILTNKKGSYLVGHLNISKPLSKELLENSYAGPTILFDYKFKKKKVFKLLDVSLVLSHMDDVPKNLIIFDDGEEEVKDVKLCDKCFTLKNSVKQVVIKDKIKNSSMSTFSTQNLCKRCRDKLKEK